MDLTPENREHIDGLTPEQLVRQWRTAPAGDPWFEGETGTYWAARIGALGARERTSASKAVGWGR